MLINIKSMRQIVALIFGAGIIILIGCNISRLFNSQIGILCLPLSLGLALLFIIWIIERKKTFYYYDDDYNYYNYQNNVGSILTDTMYEEGTLGHTITTHISTIVGTGLTFFITHSIVTTYVSQTTPTTGLSSSTTFLLNTAITAMIILATTLTIYLRNHQTKI